MDEVREKMENEKKLRDCDDGSREEKLAELLRLRKANQEFAKSISLYEKCDPKYLEEIKGKKKICESGVNRWTDNLFEIEGWMRKNNPGMSKDEID